MATIASTIAYTPPDDLNPEFMLPSRSFGAPRGFIPPAALNPDTYHNRRPPVETLPEFRCSRFAPVFRPRLP
jgi:hypothetical protein